MESLIKEFLSQRCFAVVGSFRNQSKVAYRILETLRSKGYRVIPINPWKKEVAGLKSYPSISDTQEPIDVVDLVTPPEVTEKVVRECKQKGITRVWMQPGAQSDAAVAFCKENGIACVYNLCVMLEAI